MLIKKYKNNKINCLKKEYLKILPKNIKFNQNL